VVRSNALCSRFCFGHVTAVLGLAVPAIARAMVHFARGINPDLTGAATGARSGALAGLVASPHDCTLPWPRQAPERLVPVKAVPSLQVAVTVGVLCAWMTPIGRKSAATRVTDSEKVAHRSGSYERR
jgi:hypothetical protein